MILDIMASDSNKSSEKSSYCYSRQFKLGEYNLKSESNNKLNNNENSK